MARSYLPSKVSEIVAIWRKDLNKVASDSDIFAFVYDGISRLLCVHDIL